MKLKDLNNDIITVTPEIEDPFLKSVRHKEVLLYLKQSNQENTPWFTIDDTPAFYKPESPVVYTDTKTGFTVDDCIKVEKMVKLITANKSG